MPWLLNIFLKNFQKSVVILTWKGKISAGAILEKKTSSDHFTNYKYLLPLDNF